MAYPQKPITITASTTLDPDTHGMTTTKLSAAAGLTVTLPDATGSGMVYDIYVATTVTSNDYIIQVPDASNVIQGAVTISTDIAGVSVPTAATSDTITMNGSTTGGVIGSNLRLVDVAADTWQVSGHLISTGVEATPFSAAVS
ncbi:hypothetical protein JY97_00665 [Alkalispirochaeta odontotermitis]|nr:hypothetical protein JY97_00665 [Alkalispirochaeta odontotermitis]